MPDHNEELMKRFLVGEVTDEERGALEERFFVDAEFFEALTALEHEMLVSLVQDTLPERWATPLRAALRGSTDRQRRLDEVTQLVDGLKRLAAAAPGATAVVVPIAPAFRWLPAAAVVFLALGIGAWWWQNRSATNPYVAAHPAGTVQPDGLIVSLVLGAGPTRAPGSADNLLRIPANAERVRLTAFVDGATAAAVEAQMRAVGGAELGLPAETTVRTTGPGLEVEWIVPAASLPAGDYLITYRARPAGDVLASRFVRVAR